tara:strand:- start:1104 stop:1970 length:867 start_codon:yes stop_codon:yes gene_type:complete
MAEENAQEELDLEVEIEEPKNDIEKADVEIVDDDDQFKKAESSTQKRIDRLTKKMRTAEREKEEAFRYAEQVQSESNKLKSRISNLDVSYVQEYGTRVDTQMKEAENELKQAMELGDTSAAVASQRKVTQLTLENERVNQAKAQQKRHQSVHQQPQQQYVQQPPQRPAAKKPDPKAEDWASNNSWFGSDEAMTFAAFGIHKKLVEEEGFDATSDDYYSELDNRIREEFPQKMKSNGAGSKRPSQTVASVSRSATGRSGKQKVRLTPTQVDMARRLGVPLEEYAKHVKG